MPPVVTPEDVREWWDASCGRRPRTLPSADANARLAATIRMCMGLPTLSDKQAPPSPVANARRTLIAAAECAVSHWRGVLDGGAAGSATGTAEHALQSAERLLHALRLCPADWLLEPHVERTTLGWEANAAFLYRHVRRAWVAAGNKPARPHAKTKTDADPVCRFLYSALQAIGTPAKSVSAIAQYLLKEHKARRLPNDDGVSGSAIEGW